MHALKRFGTAFGGYKMMENTPFPNAVRTTLFLKSRQPLSAVPT